MNIKYDYPVMIFRKDYQGNTFYRLGISKKDKNDRYLNGYIPCQFKKGVSLENKTKIYLKAAWLSFYLKDKTTVPYIFINEFETLKDTIENAKITDAKDPYEDFGQSIEINQEELPF